MLKISKLRVGQYYRCKLSGLTVLIITKDTERGTATGKIFFKGEFSQITVNDNQLEIC